MRESFCLRSFCYFLLLSSMLQTGNSEVNQFLNEICSFRGKFKNDDCVCEKQYLNLKESSSIEGIPIKCSYLQKSKLVTTLLSVCLPFGFEFYYLEYYIWFAVIFVICWVVILLNAYNWVYYSETKPYLKIKRNALLLVLLGIVILSRIAVFILLVFFDIIKDYNDYNLYNDLGLLQTFQSG